MTIRIPYPLPTLDWDNKRDAIEQLARRGGLSWESIGSTHYKISGGSHVIATIPARNLHKRLLAELLELAGSRICFGFREHPFYTLNALRDAVLQRAVAQGLSSRYQCSEGDE